MQNSRYRLQMEELHRLFSVIWIKNVFREMAEEFAGMCV